MKHFYKNKMFAVVFVMTFVVTFAAKLPIINKETQIVYLGDDSYQLKCPFDPITDWYCGYNDGTAPLKLGDSKEFLKISQTMDIVCICEQVNDDHILRQKIIIRAPRQFFSIKLIIIICVTLVVIIYYRR
jgi:hypothetical protein